jgi:hypothetical protein
MGLEKPITARHLISELDTWPRYMTVCICHSRTYRVDPGSVSNLPPDSAPFIVVLGRLLKSSCFYVVCEYGLERQSLRVCRYRYNKE